MAKLLDGVEGVPAGSGVRGYVIVWKGTWLGVVGGREMWTAKVQILVWRLRFSTEVVLRRTNWRELRDMPRLKSVKRPALDVLVCFMNGKGRRI